jgi:3-oxoacyl-[acyl-carrier protein] reductase
MSRIVLVTGASRGIGRAVACALAPESFVLVGCQSRVTEAEETCRLVREAGGEAAVASFDVGDAGACALAVEGIVARHGRLDVLVNNAALSVDGLLMRLKDDDWHRQLAVNLTGPMALCRSASRTMLKQRSGAIVNVASVVGESGNAGQGAYAAAKAGLLGLTKSLAKELAPRGVRVNAVSPGFIDTDMTERLPDEVSARILSQVPLGRLGSADEVAHAVAFLSSGRASYITGEVLRVNGGLYT